jgi:hypothetical protein
MPAPKTPPAPRLGDVVLYRLTENDAADVERRRADWRTSPSARWGYQAHVGNPVRAESVYAAVVVSVSGPSTVNLAVLLDGTDTLWAPSAGEGTGPGTWARPPA